MYSVKSHHDTLTIMEVLLGTQVGFVVFNGKWLITLGNILYVNGNNPLLIPIMGMQVTH